MSDPVKNNDQILSDKQAFIASFLRARVELGKLDGVAGVAYGLKQTGGVFGQEIGLVVYVHEKKSPAALKPGHQIPATFEGYRTDVRTIADIAPSTNLGPPELCDNDRYSTLIHGGIQIQTPGKRPVDSPGKGSGTLGCIVKKKGDRGRDNVYLLTNKHVLDDNGAKRGDKIYHPFAPGNTSRHVQDHPDWDQRIVALGPIDTELWVEGDSVEYMHQPPQGVLPYYLDAGIARIEIDCTCCLGMCICQKDKIVVDQTLIRGLNVDFQNFAADKRDRIADVRDIWADPAIFTEKVCKVGHITGRTFGQVTVVGVPQRLGINYTNCMEIILDTEPGKPNLPQQDRRNCQSTNSFNEHGDSGSAVLDMQNKLIGLIFGLLPDPTSNDPELLRLRYSYASLIVPVLDHLGVRVPTLGGSHSLCAGENEGWQPGPSQFVEPPPKNPEKILFKSASATNARRDETPVSQTLTSSQLARLQPLRAVLEETLRGREIHDDFEQLDREIAYLVRRCRPVTVTWHRNHGPGFLAFVMKQMNGELEALPREIGGITRTALLTRMRAVLRAHGSNLLRDALDRHGDVILRLADAETAQECLDILQHLDATMADA